MELITIGNTLLKDFQLHIFGVLLLSYRAYARMDKRHEVDSAKNSLKFEHIDESIDGLKKVVESSKKDTDKKFEDMHKKVDSTVVYLQNKWGDRTDGKDQQKRILTEAEIYAKTKGQAEAESRASQA